MFLPVLVSAAPEQSGKEIEALTKLLSPYRQSSGLTSPVEKSFFQEFKGKTDLSQGRISLYKGRLKLKISSPEESQSLMVLNSKALWLEVPFGEDFPPSVTKVPLKSFKSLEGVWSLLLGKGSLSDIFEVSKGDLKSGEFVLKPKKVKDSDLDQVELKFNGSDLSQLIYEDQLGNRVGYKFEDWKSKKMLMNEFEYTPPEGASVSEL